MVENQTAERGGGMRMAITKSSNLENALGLAAKSYHDVVILGPLV